MRVVLLSSYHKIMKAKDEDMTLGVLLLTKRYDMYSCSYYELVIWYVNVALETSVFN